MTNFPSFSQPNGFKSNLNRAREFPPGRSIVRFRPPNLPLAGEPGLECRNSAGKHKFVFSFNNPVVSGSASLTLGTGTVSGNPHFSGNTMTVNLTGVSDVQKITVTLTDVTDTSAHVLPPTDVSANMLIGDRVRIR